MAADIRELYSIDGPMIVYGLTDARNMSFEDGAVGAVPLNWTNNGNPTPVTPSAVVSTDDFFVRGNNEGSQSTLITCPSGEWHWIQQDRADGIVTWSDIAELRAVTGDRHVDVGGCYVFAFMAKAKAGTGDFRLRGTLELRPTVTNLVPDRHVVDLENFHLNTDWTPVVCLIDATKLNEPKRFKIRISINCTSGTAECYIDYCHFGRAVNLTGIIDKPENNFLIGGGAPGHYRDVDRLFPRGFRKLRVRRSSPIAYNLGDGLEVNRMGKGKATLEFDAGAFFDYGGQIPDVDIDGSVTQGKARWLFHRATQWHYFMSWMAMGWTAKARTFLRNGQLGNGQVSKSAIKQLETFTFWRDIGTKFGWTNAGDHFQYCILDRPTRHSKGSSPPNFDTSVRAALPVETNLL